MNIETCVKCGMKREVIRCQRSDHADKPCWSTKLWEHEYCHDCLLNSGHHETDGCHVCDKLPPAVREVNRLGDATVTA